eukprot:s2244_g3.t1
MSKSLLQSPDNRRFGVQGGLGEPTGPGSEQDLEVDPLPGTCDRLDKAQAVQGGTLLQEPCDPTSQLLVLGICSRGAMGGRRGKAQAEKDRRARAHFEEMRASKREMESARHNAAVKIQKVARGNSVRALLKRQMSQIVRSSAAKVQALVRGRLVRNSLRHGARSPD